MTLYSGDEVRPSDRHRPRVRKLTKAQTRVMRLSNVGWCRKNVDPVTMVSRHTLDYLVDFFHCVLTRRLERLTGRVLVVLDAVLDYLGLSPFDGCGAVARLSQG